MKSLAVSKVTRQYQATIPSEVLQALGLHQGDSVAFVLEGDRVVLRRATPLDREFIQALESNLDKWLSAHDENAYRDL